VASVLTFRPGTSTFKLSGPGDITAVAPVVTGAGVPVVPEGNSDANGIVRLDGPVESAAFTAVSLSDALDGMYLHVGVLTPVLTMAERSQLQALTARLADLIAPHRKCGRTNTPPSPGYTASARQATISDESGWQRRQVVSPTGR
jgi:hypothetical protein